MTIWGRHTILKQVLRTGLLYDNPSDTAENVAKRSFIIIIKRFYFTFSEKSVESRDYF